VTGGYANRSRTATTPSTYRAYFGGVLLTTAADLELTEQTQAAVKVEADRVLAALSGPHPESVTVKAVHGYPVEELVSASKDADIVVLGSRGAGGFSRMLMGSTAGLVVQHAHCWPATARPTSC
jgi:nucleotide-binding universal stress UspA family protein